MTKKTQTFKTTKHKHSRRQETDIQDNEKNTNIQDDKKPRILYQAHLFPVKLPNLTAKHAIYIALFHIIVTKLLQLCFVRR